MRKIYLLTLNDLACSLRNKSFYLVFFIPLFLFVIFHLLDRSNSEVSPFKVGLIQHVDYAPNMMQALHSAEKNLEIVWVKDQAEGQIFLKEKKVYAFLELSLQKNNQLTLVVLQKDSPRTLALTQLFSNLQNAVEKKNANWVAEIRSLHEGNIQKQTLPTWILMVVLLIGFIILPAQVAEEKEKKLLLALLSTPIHELHWLTGKILMGLFLTLISVLLLQILTQVIPANLFAFFAFALVAGYCFSAFGIFLGFLCRNQASARTLGIVFYLPLLVPVALSDFSKKMTSFLALLPSYQFYEPLQKIIFEDAGSASLLFSWFYLFTLGSALMGLSYILIKKRWLM